MPCNDCSRTESCPPCPEEQEDQKPLFAPGAEEYYRKVLGLEPKPVEPEPPMTPEEEEQAPPDGYEYGCPDCGQPITVGRRNEHVCKQAPPDEGFGDCPGWPECPKPGSCPACSTPKEGPPPPQPVRRPPYAIAYSVQGHLYEVALPGDATVRAVDGALVITHALGPVAGIVQAAPYGSEEGS